ncbi:MAG: cation:proton antiporter [Mariprofundales bacterium]|nr:cation:proton antiporter [Mariprofundales bacterium]
MRFSSLSMLSIDTPTTVFVVAVLMAVFAQVVAERLRTPAILPWLITGMVMGPFGVHILHAEMLGAGLHTLIELGLAIILFEGGLNLNLKSLKIHRFVVIRLILIGPLLNTVVGGAAAHWLVGLSWPLALLFGALIAVGGPTVITPILRQVRVNRALNHILISEAMLIDAVGAILAIVLLQFCLPHGVDYNWQNFVTIIGEKLLIGIVVGSVAGVVMTRMLNHGIIANAELRMSVALVLVWTTLVVADTFSSQAGLLAVLVAGSWLQNQNVADIQRLRHFKGSLAMLLIAVLFVLLSSTIDLAMLLENLGVGSLIFILLALLVRPVIAYLSTVGSELSPQQVGFIAMMAPRGVVAAAVASLFAMILADAGVAQARLMEALVFCTILLSVLLYSLIAKPVSRYLQVSGSDETSVLIIGGGQLGLELGRTLAQAREVRYLDLNTEVITAAKRLGHIAVAGNALDPLFMEVVHAEEVGAVLVMTGSTDHNLLIANLAHDQFRVPNLYIGMQEGDEKKHAKTISRLGVTRLFGKPWTFSYWQDQANRKRLMHMSQLVDSDSGLAGHLLSAVRIPHGVQPLAVQRGDELLLTHDNLQLLEGDEILVLLRPERVDHGQSRLMPPNKDNMMG